MGARTSFSERAGSGRRGRSCRSRGRVRVASALGVAMALGAIAIVSACLPDLSPFPPAPRPRAAQSLGCGDGVVETLDDGGDAGESCDPGDASSAGCQGCVFLCPGGRVDEAGHCYFLAEPTATYSDALASCRRADGHLVTFSSERELAFAASVVGDAGPFWVGLTYVPALGAYAAPVDEPGWPSGADSCAGCFAVGADGGQFAVHPSEDASALSLGRECLVADRGSWLQVRCIGSEPRQTLCEREAVGQRVYPCGGLLCTTLSVTAGKKRYVIWPFEQTAGEASELCRTTYRGGHLVVLDSREEREQLVREIVQRLRTDPGDPPLELWIGLSTANGAWTWDDGRPAIDAGRPLPWGIEEPKAAGGRAFLHIDEEIVDTQLARTDEDAGARRVFICQRPVD